MEAGTELKPAGLSRQRLAAIRTRAWTFAERVNLPLLAIVAGAFALIAYYSLKVTDWMVMTDELQHVKLAVSIAETLNPLPRIRGEHVGQYAQLYPLLTAPAYGFFDMATGFRVAHGLNALIMATTAIPAYLLARAVLGVRWVGWLVAALTVAVPWMAMSNLLMTEVAAYPAFVWAVYAIYRAIAEPRPRNDLVGIAAIVVAFFARTQLLALAAAFPAAVVVHELGFALSTHERVAAVLRRMLREHVVLVAAVVPAAIAYLVLQATGRIGLVVGNYSITTGGAVFPKNFWYVAQQLWAVIAVAIAIVPAIAALGWTLATIVRPQEKRTHAFAALGLVASLILTWQVSSFLARFSIAQLQDRYLFYVVPLLFIGFAACLLESRVRWRSLTVCLVLATVVFARLIELTAFTPGVSRPFFASPPTLFNIVLTGRSGQLGNAIGNPALSPTTVLWIAAVVLGVALLIALLLLPGRRLLAVAGIGLLVFCAAETAYVSKKMVEPFSKGAPKYRDWVDNNLPPDAKHVVMIPGGVNSTTGGSPIFVPSWEQWGIWWTLELWNKSTDRTLQYEDDPTAGGTPFATSPLKVNRTTGAAEANVDTPYFVVSPSDVRQRLRAKSLVTEPSSGLELIRADSPMRFEWVTTGIGAEGWTASGSPATIRIFAEPGAPVRVRQLHVTLNSTPEITFDKPYLLSSGPERVRRVVPAGGTGSDEGTIDVCVRAPFTDVTLLVPHASTVANVGPNAGLHVAKIKVGPARRACAT